MLTQIVGVENKQWIKIVSNMREAWKGQSSAQGIGNSVWEEL